MGFDSSANLLYSISANTDDATGNVQKFRSLMSKDLSAMQAEFEDWSKKVLGSVSTVSGAMTAGVAALGAGLVAGAAFALESAHKYEEYVSTIAAGAKVMQVTAEQASVLHYAVSRTGGDFEGLSRGVSFFEAAVVKANAGNKEILGTFDRLGISRAQLAAGEKNILPLLGQVSDQWRNLASGAQRAAIARDLFSRQWAATAGVLKLGTAGLKEMGDETERLGRIVTAADVAAVKDYKIAVKELKEQGEMLAVSFGREVLPLLTEFTALMYGAAKAMKQGFETKATWADYATLGLKSWLDFFQRTGANADEFRQNLVKLRESMKAVGDGQLKAPAVEKKTLDDWHGLSDLLEQVKGKLAGVQGDEERNAQEIEHLRYELAKAQEEYKKLADAGKLSADSRKREAQQTGAIETKITELATQQQIALEKKKAEAFAVAEAELQQKLDAQAQVTAQVELQRWADEIAKLRAANTKKGAEYERLDTLIDQIEAAGRSRITRAHTEQYQQELEQLQQFLAQVVTARMTTAERLAYQYDVDVAKFSEAEEEKASAAARSAGQDETAVHQQFAILRSALLNKYGQDLTALQNSQGWQGVFGSRFAQLLAHDEEALRQWSTSADQAMAMVGLRMQALEGLGREAFDSLAQGMAQNVASAAIYDKSIGRAMRSALASTLETIAAESLVQVIYSSALGLLRLAQHDYPAASAAFSAAATFGLVGGAAIVVGRAIAPKDQSAAAGASGSAGSSGTAAGGAGAAAAPEQKVAINIHVYGNIYRDTDALIDALNEAVDRGKELTATNTTTEKVVRR